MTRGGCPGFSSPLVHFVLTEEKPLGLALGKMTHS